MKTRLSLLTVFTLATLASASANPAATDSAAVQLAARGTLHVAAAGPFVELGTFRVQVAAKLGRPDVVLADGTWAYQHRRVEQSAAEGTLLVRFNAQGRVAALQLVTPALFATLRDNPRGAPADLLAKK